MAKICDICKKIIWIVQKRVHFRVDTEVNLFIYTGHEKCYNKYAKFYKKWHRIYGWKD